jgi:hypothetical protein
LLVNSVVSFTLAADEFWLSFVMGALIALALSMFLTSSTALPVTVGRVDKVRGIVRLRFRNPAYESYIVQRTLVEQSTGARTGGN